MLFDSTAIIFSLIASVITKWDATDTYQYGFGRVETLTGFINALALIMASGGIMWEALERLFLNSPKLETNNLLLVSVLGLVVNIVGIFAFDHGGAAHGHAGHSHGVSHGSHDHHHDHIHGSGGSSCGSATSGGIFSAANKNPLMHGMFLHILSDALGSVGVIISSLLIEYYGWYWSDPVCSIFISLLTFAGAWPLVKSSGQVLLQRTPPHLDLVLPRLYQSLHSIPGVLASSKHRFWELSSHEVVGSAVVQIRDGCDDQAILRACLDVFRQEGVNATIQIEKDQVAKY